VTLATAAGGAAAPFATSSYVASRPVRTSIVNRATGTNPAFFSPMQMPPVFGMSQRGLDGPVPVEIPPQEDEKQSMLGNDYPVPVDLVDPADVLARRGLRYGRV
jgi:hypothetical protein